MKLIRVYATGKIKAEEHDRTWSILDWLKYNSNHHPGCALVIAGTIVEGTGYPEAQMQALDMIDKGVL